MMHDAIHETLQITDNNGGRHVGQRDLTNNRQQRWETCRSHETLQITDNNGGRHVGHTRPYK